MLLGGVLPGFYDGFLSVRIRVPMCRQACTWSLRLLTAEESELFFPWLFRWPLPCDSGGSDDPSSHRGFVTLLHGGGCFLWKALALDLLIQESEWVLWPTLLSFWLCFRRANLAWHEVFSVFSFFPVAASLRLFFFFLLFAN